MPMIDPLPEPVPFVEVAAVLDAAVCRAGGGPPGLIGAAGAQLAAALTIAGFQVVRRAVPGAQLTL